MKRRASVSISTRTEAFQSCEPKMNRVLSERERLAQAEANDGAQEPHAACSAF